MPNEGLKASPPLEDGAESPSHPRLHLVERAAESQSPGPIVNARVVSVSDDGLSIRVGSEAHPAKTAFSCLIQPLPGDLALCVRDEAGDYCLLGILDRPGSRNMTLRFPGEVALVAKQGSIQLLSDQSLTLIGSRINCLAERTVHTSQEAVVDYAQLTARGDSLRAIYKNVQLISDLINTMAGQVIERMKTYLRHTDGFDQVKAGHMGRKVDGLYAMDSKNTVMVSEKDTKIDGEWIHMG